MIIRNAGNTDIPALEKLYRILEEDAVRYQSEHFVLSPEGTRFPRGVPTDEERQILLVAEENGFLAGFAHAGIYQAKNAPCLKPQSNVYAQDIVVAKELRGIGIGTMLMDAVKAYGKEHGAEFSRLQVFPMNRDGIRFYARNGFADAMLTMECPI